VRLKQCLLNVLSNACKFTHAGRVTFSVTQERTDQGDSLLFRVRDTGIGLSDEQVARLFQPFTQLMLRPPESLAEPASDWPLQRNSARPWAAALSWKANSELVRRLPSSSRRAERRRNADRRDNKAVLPARRLRRQTSDPRNHLFELPTRRRKLSPTMRKPSTCSSKGISSRQVGLTGFEPVTCRRGDRSDLMI